MHPLGHDITEGPSSTDKLYTFQNSSATLSASTSTPKTMHTDQTRQAVTFSLPVGGTFYGDILVAGVSVPTLAGMKLLEQGYTIHLERDSSDIQRFGQ